MLGLVVIRRALPLLCIAFAMAALAYVSQDHFVAHVGNQARLISRAGDPVEYWTGAGGLIFVAVACFVGSLYLQRR